jgi:flagellar assembly factor FliW
MTAVKVAPNHVKSQFLGDLSSEPGSELFLPNGIPGFEAERFLLPIEIPAHRPLVFLQSTLNPETCFVCLPASSIASQYEVTISEDDRAILELQHDRNLVMGEDILCLALLLPAAGTVRTNLDAPIVINLRNYRCAQIVTPLRLGSVQLTESGCWKAIC